MALTTGTYEAQVIELFGDRGDVIRYTCADGTTISKGTLLKITGTRTASKSASSDAGSLHQPVAGIASADKEADDGSTTIGVYTNGIFEMRLDEGVNRGDAVMISGANTLCKGVEAGTISGAILGYAMETGAAGAEIAVRVRC